MATEKEELQARAKELGLDTEGTIQELKDRINQASEKPADPPADKVAADGTVDVAVDGRHPASIVEKLPDDQKPGPASHMSTETRPDEQDLPPGTSALQNTTASP